MRKTETLNLRVSVAFKRKLTKEAKKQRRSLTNYLEATLDKLWQELDSAKTGAKQEKNI